MKYQPRPMVRPGYRPFGAFRFILALMVLAQHGLLLLPEAEKAAFYGLELGAVAVGVFFALSGHVAAEAITRFYNGRPGAFLLNRVLRIVPPYAAAFLMTATIASLAYAHGRLVTLDAPLHGAPWQPRVLLSGVLEILPALPARRISGQDFSFIPFAWTLRTEMLFYLAVAFWCRWPKLRWGRFALATCGYASFVAFAIWHAHLPQQMLCIPFFMLGVRSFGCETAGTMRKAELILLLACAAYGFTFWSQRGHPHFSFQVPLLLALLLALLGLARAGAVTGRVKSWDQRLGELSYPLYVGHGAVLLALLNATRDRGWALYGAGIVLSLLLAAGLHRLVELPLRRIRARIRRAEL